MTTQGPDFTNCGNPVDWADRQPLDERFPQAITNALGALGVDIELARWNKEAPIVGEYVTWWSAQREAIIRELATVAHVGLKPVVSRRTDKSDGFTKCYIRFDRLRPKAVTVAA